MLYSHKDFLRKEFALTEKEIAKMNRNELHNLREKCFDIEVEEAVIADDNDTDVSQRGELAAEVVDLLMPTLQSM
jgi:hypothetical protein